MRLGKGGKDRTIMLPQSLEPSLMDYLNIYHPRTYLFENAVPGDPLSRRTFQILFRNALGWLRAFIPGLNAPLHSRPRQSGLLQNPRHPRQRCQAPLGIMPFSAILEFLRSIIQVDVCRISFFSCRLSCFESCRRRVFKIPSSAFPRPSHTRPE
jgi:hypothetical protein